MRMLDAIVTAGTIAAAGFSATNYFVQKSEYRADQERIEIQQLSRHKQVLRMYDEARLEATDNRLNMLQLIPEEERTELQRSKILELTAQRELLLINMRP